MADLEELQRNIDSARDAMANAAWKFKLANDHRHGADDLTLAETETLLTLRTRILEYDYAVLRLEEAKRW